MGSQKILFLCSANKDRSVVAEQYFSTHDDTNHHQYMSAGLNEKAVNSARKKVYDNHMPRYVREGDLRSHDLIVVMEEKHKTWIHNHFLHYFPDELSDVLEKIVVIHIPDNYNRKKQEDNEKFCELIHDKLFGLLRLKK